MSFKRQVCVVNAKIGKRYLELEQELESFRREARNQGLSNLQADLRLRDYRVLIYFYF